VPPCFPLLFFWAQRSPGNSANTCMVLPFQVGVHVFPPRCSGLLLSCQPTELSTRWAPCVGPDHRIFFLLLESRFTFLQKPDVQECFSFPPCCTVLAVFPVFFSLPRCGFAFFFFFRHGTGPFSGAPFLTPVTPPFSGQGDFPPPSPWQRIFLVIFWLFNASVIGGYPGGFQFFCCAFSRPGRLEIILSAPHVFPVFAAAFCPHFRCIKFFVSQAMCAPCFFFLITLHLLHSTFFSHCRSCWRVSFSTSGSFRSSHAYFYAKHLAFFYWLSESTIILCPRPNGHTLALLSTPRFFWLFCFLEPLPSKFG